MKSAGMRWWLLVALLSPPARERGHGPAPRRHRRGGAEGLSGRRLHRHGAGGGVALPGPALLLEDFFGGGAASGAAEVAGAGQRRASSTPRGIIVTNDHVIRGASAIHVVLADGRTLEAEVMGSDAANDLAVLKVSAKQPLPAAKLGTSSDLMIGETVIAIGSPLGLAEDGDGGRGVAPRGARSGARTGTSTTTSCRRTRRSTRATRAGRCSTWTARSSASTPPSSRARRASASPSPRTRCARIVDELTRFGKVRPAWVGIETADLPPRLAAQLGWDR